MIITVKVERSLPADTIREPSGKGHTDDGSGVGSAESQGCQSGALEWRSPPSPDPVTCRISDPFNESLQDSDHDDHNRMKFGCTGQEHIEESRDSNGRSENPIFFVCDMNIIS